MYLNMYRHLLSCFYEGYICLRSQALEGAFNEFSVDLTDEEQTAENILDVLRQAVMELYNTIMEELKKKHALKVNYSSRLCLERTTNEIFSTCKQNESHLKLLNNLNT